MKTMPFDYTIHDPKYDDISSVYSPGYKPGTDGRNNCKRTLTRIYEHRTFIFSKRFLVVTTQIQTFPHTWLSHCALVLICCLSKQTLFVRRTFIFAEGRLGLSCQNMQLTTLTIIVNSVISTWALTPGTRWAEHTKHSLMKDARTPLLKCKCHKWCSMSSLLGHADVWVNTTRLHIHTPTAGGRDPALLHHPKV